MVAETIPEHLDESITHPPLDLCEKGKRHSPTDRIVRHDEVDDSIGRGVMYQSILPDICVSSGPHFLPSIFTIAEDSATSTQSFIRAGTTRKGKALVGCVAMWQRQWKNQLTGEFRVVWWDLRQDSNLCSYALINAPTLGRSAWAGLPGFNSAVPVACSTRTVVPRATRACMRDMMSVRGM